MYRFLTAATAMTIVIYDIIIIMLVVYKGNMLPFSKYRRDLLYHIAIIYAFFPIRNGMTTWCLDNKLRWSWSGRRMGNTRLCG